MSLLPVNVTRIKLDKHPPSDCGPHLLVLACEGTKIRYGCQCIRSLTDRQVCSVSACVFMSYVESASDSRVD